LARLLLSLALPAKVYSLVGNFTAKPSQIIFVQFSGWHSQI